MSLKFIIGIIQIVFSLILIVGMVLGLTMIRSTVNEGVDAGSKLIPANLKSKIDVTVINKMVIGTSVMVGLLGILFFLQGFINFKKETPKIEPSKTTKQEKPIRQVDLKKDIPDEY